MNGRGDGGGCTAAWMVASTTLLGSASIYIPLQLLHGCQRRNAVIPPQLLHGCGIVILAFLSIGVLLRAGRYLSARSGRLPSSPRSSSLQQPAFRQPGYGSFVRPVLYFLKCLWSAATRGMNGRGDGGGCTAAWMVASTTLLGSASIYIPLQLLHGCQRRNAVIPPQLLHGCGIVILAFLSIGVLLRAGRYLSARSGRLPSSPRSSSLQQPAFRQPGYGSFVRPVLYFLKCLWSAATRGRSGRGDGGGCTAAWMVASSTLPAG